MRHVVLGMLLHRGHESSLAVLRRQRNCSAAISQASHCCILSRCSVCYCFKRASSLRVNGSRFVVFCIQRSRGDTVSQSSHHRLGRRDSGDFYPRESATPNPVAQATGHVLVLQSCPRGMLPSEPSRAIIVHQSAIAMASCVSSDGTAASTSSAQMSSISRILSRHCAIPSAAFNLLDN